MIPYRNPLEAIPSLLKLMRGFWALRGVDDATIRRGFARLFEQSIHAYTHPIDVLARHPDRPVSVVDYRELVAHAKRVVARIYAELGYEMTPGYEARLDDAEAHAGRHETQHRYSLDEFGLDEAGIRSALAPLFDRFQWPGAEASLSSRRSAPDR